MATALSLVPDVPPAPPVDPLREGLVLLAQLLGRPTSVAELGDGLPLKDGRLPIAMAPRALRRVDVAGRVADFRLADLDAMLLPALLVLTGGETVVATGLGDGTIDLVSPATGGGAQTLAIAEVQARYSGTAVFAKPRYRPDGRALRHHAAVPLVVRTAPVEVIDGELEAAVAAGERLQDLDAGGDHLGADAVAGNGCNLVGLHG